MEKKRVKRIKAGIGRREISDALNEFYIKSLEPKFEQINPIVAKMDVLK